MLLFRLVTALSQCKERFSVNGLLKVLNNLVAAYFDLAELNAIEEREMRMADYLRELDNILRTTGRNVLDNAGQISHEQAKKKAIAKYKKYKAKTLSNVEKDYLNSITMLEQTAKKANRIKAMDKTISSKEIKKGPKDE